MNLEKVTPGDRVPDEINVIVEIPSHSNPVKYEIDKTTGALFVDRFMNAAMFYPCNYGYIPHTLSEDGDPIDVLVVSPIALLTGSVVRCRPVAMLAMTDEAGRDQKVLAVPTHDICPLYPHVHGPEDLPPTLLAQIAHFFQHYKDLDGDKWVNIDGWQSAKEAKIEILSGVERFRYSPTKPPF